MPKDENHVFRKVAVGVTTALLTAAIAALLLLWRNAHGDVEHSRQIAIEVPTLLEPIKEDVQQIRIEQAEQRTILDRIDRKLEP